jgi:hypothetical protein
MMNIKPPLLGALAGALLGVSWLIWDWRFLWIAAFVIGGALLGWIFSLANLSDKLRNVVKVMRGE